MLNFFMSTFSQSLHSKQLYNPTNYHSNKTFFQRRLRRWMSADPAMYQGDYIPGAPIDDEARKRNQNLPGQGGIFNYVNLHVYHYAGNNPVKYKDPTGRDIYVFNDNISEALTYLYVNSKSFKRNLDFLMRPKNNSGERLLAYFNVSENKYPGFTQTKTDKAKNTISTITIDEKGNLQAGRIEEGEMVQGIFINIDINKIKERKLNILEVLTEEVFHAVDASIIGSDKFNKAIIEEQENYKYGECPLESSAKARTKIVLDELPKWNTIYYFLLY